MLRCFGVCKATLSPQSHLAMHSYIGDRVISGEGIDVGLQWFTEKNPTKQTWHGLLKLKCSVFRRVSPAWRSYPNL